MLSEDAEYRENSLNHMRTFILFTWAMLYVVFSGEAATAKSEHWVARFLKGGTIEASVSSGHGNSIAITCNWVRMEPDENKLGYVLKNGLYPIVSIEFEINGHIPSGNKIILKFDNKDPLEADIKNGEITNIRDACPECMKNYNKIIDLFTANKRVTVVTEDGESATFTLRGAARAIPECVYKLKGDAT